MKFCPLISLASAIAGLAWPCGASAQTNSAEVFSRALLKLVAVVAPATNEAPSTLSAQLELTQTDGLPKGVEGAAAGRCLPGAGPAPGLGKIDGHDFAAGRDGQQLWAYAPGKKFGVIGEPGQPLFLATPEKTDKTRLAPLTLPLPKEQLLLLPLLLNLEPLAPENVDDMGCFVLQASARPEAQPLLKLPAGKLILWIRTNDFLPARIGVRDEGKTRVQVTLHDVKLGAGEPDSFWRLPAHDGDRVEKTAVAHLLRFLPVAYDMLNQHIASLGPATGERKVVATEGRGRLEMVDGTRVLYLAGTPQEMGQQQGTLLRKQIRHMVGRILYGVGVGSSFEKGRWFFGEIEDAQKRISPFIDPRYLEEMDAMARAARLDSQEIRLANFFPELFHCSGFAFVRQGHGRWRYVPRPDPRLSARGSGLEQNAVVVVYQPDQGNAWVNVSLRRVRGLGDGDERQTRGHRRNGGKGRGPVGRQAHGAVGARGDGEGRYSGAGRGDHCAKGPARASTTT